jgi:hypothetical protein
VRKPGQDEWRDRYGPERPPDLDVSIVTIKTE